MTQPAVAERVRTLGYPDLLDPSTIAKFESGDRPIPSSLLPYLTAALGLNLTDIQVCDHCEVLAAVVA